MAVVREDTVKLTFDYDDRGATRAENQMDDLLESTQKLGGSQGTGKAESGFEDAHKAAKKFGDTSLNKLSSGLDSITKSVGKVAMKLGGLAVKGLTAGAAATTAGLTALGTQAVKGYAEYEQLVGGVETLFGSSTSSVEDFTASIGKSTEEIKAFQRANGLAVDGIIGPQTTAAIQKAYDSMADASKTVMTNANDAYKTAGLSANEYMDTVTSFSASLISSLGGDTAKAANYADQAIVDMSDNANKMGTDMEMIQNAYQGFAKQNYTMLDNLKLGYGGTKEEMQRLLKDAEKITGKKFDISNFADITEAIHAIQTEMGITGTTAKEASTTIQGSALAMKAAWSNFITGMADENANFDQLLDNLVDSVKTFMKNLIPRIKKMLPRLVRGLTEIAKIIGREMPGILEEIVPSLIDGVVSLMGSMYDVFVENISTFKKIGLQIIKYIYKGLTGKEMSGDMFESLEKKVNQAFEAVKNIVSGLIDFGRVLMETVGPALVWIGDLALDAFTWIGDNINWILPVLSSLLGAMLAFKAVKKVTGIVSGFMGLFSKGGKGNALGGLTGDAGTGGNGGGLFSSFANMKPTTILKGMLNLSIVIGGLMLLGAAVAKAAPYIASLSDGKSLAEVLTICGTVGVVGAGMTKLASMVGNIPVSTVVKGLASIAIIMGGLSLLCIALNFVTKIDFDYTSMLKLLGIIAVTGLVGSALAGLAGLIGAIPIPVVLTGLGNIALALGGFTAIVEAFGLLSAIPGFTEFLTKGGEVLAEICRIIGEMAGSIIGGIGEGITNSLPAIGENISAFANSIAPAMATFSSMNFEGIKSFASAFGQFVLVMTGEKMLSWFTGGINYAQIGTDLTALTTNGAGFFEAVQNIPEAAFTNATMLFECLNGIGLLPNSGGVAQWFTGEVDYQGIANGLAILGGESVIAALTAITAIPADAYSSLTALFDALAGIKQMPKEGGIFGWFSGDNSTGLSNVASQLPGVAENIASFFTNLGGRTDFSPITNLFETLSSVKIDSDAADKGFLGLGSSEMEKMGSGLSAFATNAKGFFDAINDFDVQKMKDFFAELSTVGELPDALSSLDTTIGTSLSNLVTTVETKMGEIKTAVETGITNVLSALSLAIPNFVSSGADLMQGLNNGMLSMQGTLIATARRMATAISKTIDSAMKINSPSKVTIKQGQYVGEGYALGITETIPAVRDAANQMSTVSVPYYNSYSPETSSTVYNAAGDSETTTISPTFNLTISGSQDDRALARRVKEYVSEAIRETFASMDRKVGAVREA